MSRNLYSIVAEEEDGETPFRAQLKAFTHMLRKVNIPVRIGKDDVSNPVDGRELSGDDVEEASHLWLLKPARVFLRLHLRDIQLRGGVMSTKARAGKHPRAGNYAEGDATNRRY